MIWYYYYYSIGLLPFKLLLLLRVYSWLWNNSFFSKDSLQLLSKQLGTASPSTCGLHHCPEIHLRKNPKLIYLAASALEVFSNLALYKLTYSFIYSFIWLTWALLGVAMVLDELSHDLLSVPMWNFFFYCQSATNHNLRKCSMLHLQVIPNNLVVVIKPPGRSQMD